MTFGKILKEVPINKIGFVYSITKKSSNIKYIGCKLFYRTVTRAPLKGKKRKRKEVKESDWKTYTSSGKWSDLIKGNPSDFTYEILYLCSTKTELAAKETYEILGYYIRDEWNLLVNEMINCRIRVRPKQR